MQSRVIADVDPQVVRLPWDNRKAERIGGRTVVHVTPQISRRTATAASVGVAGNCLPAVTGKTRVRLVPGHANEPGGIRTESAAIEVEPSQRRHLIGLVHRTERPSRHFLGGYRAAGNDVRGHSIVCTGGTLDGE